MPFEKINVSEIIRDNKKDLRFRIAYLNVRIRYVIHKFLDRIFNK